MPGTSRLPARRAHRRRSRTATAALRRQPAARHQAARAADTLPAAVSQRPALHHAVRLGGHRPARPLGRYRGDLRRRAGQRGNRFHPGRQGGVGARQHSQAAVGPRHGPARRQAGGGRCRRAGARRYRAAGLGRQGAGRSAPAGGTQPAGRGSGADRRIAAHGEDHRCRRAGRPAWRSQRHGLVRHPGCVWPGQRPGGSDRCGHRAGPDQPDADPGAGHIHALATADRPLRPLAGSGHPVDGRGHLRAGYALARPPARGNVHDGGGPDRLGDPRRAAGDHDRDARHRRPAHGAPAGDRAAAASRRDAGLGDGDLLGQDRHPHPQRNDRATPGLRGPPIPGQRRRLRRARRIQPRWPTAGCR